MIEVRLHSIDNTTQRGEELAHQAVALLGRIVNTPQFLIDVESERYSYTARLDEQGRFVQHTDNGTIVQMIRSGDELRRGERGVLDLNVVIRKFGRKTMGAVYVPEPTIYTNRRYFDDWIAREDVASMAAHWMHEWMHAAGFYHGSSSGDDDDVPYAVGEIAYRIGNQLFGRPPAADKKKAATVAASYRAPCPVMHGTPLADLFDDSEEADD
jgi:hypothetical protein